MSLFDVCEKCKKEFNAEDILFNEFILRGLCGPCTDLLNWKIGEVTSIFIQPERSKREDLDCNCDGTLMSVSHYKCNKSI